LIIKIDRFGDFVLWNEYFHNILEHYKDKNIFLICNIQLENYLKRHYKKITFITIDKYSFLINLKYRIKKIFFLRNFYFEKVINFHRERDIYFSDCIVKNANAFHKIGNKIKKKSLLNYISNNYYDLLLETKDNTHEMFYLDQFTKKVLGNKSYNSKKKIFFKKNKNFKKYENCILISFGGSDKKNLYLLNIC
jgi:ADP-heptose:LPS heptosyltransferase